MSEPLDNDKYLGLYISYDNIPGEWMLEVIHKISNLYCTFGEITINLQNGIDVSETPIQPTNTYKLGEYMSTYIVKSYLDLVQYIIDEEDDFTVVSYISPVNIVLDSVKINDDKEIIINWNCLENIKTILNHPYFSKCKNLDDLKFQISQVPDLNRRYEK